MEICKNIKSEYLLQTNENPNYIFHGSPNLITNDIDPKKGHDEFGNKLNEQTAIYGISLFKGAIPYAIGKCKVSCSIGYREDNLSMRIYTEQYQRIVMDIFMYLREKILSNVMIPVNM